MQDLDPRQIVLRWQQPMYDLAQRVLGNAADAADGTQEIFLTVYRKLDRYDTSRPFKPWLYKVATRVLLNLVRKRQRVVPPVADMAQLAEVEEVQTVEQKELHRVVDQQLYQLPDDTRALLLLHYHHDMSQVELADVLALPRTTIQSRLHRALDSLKAKLREGGHFAAVPAVEPLLRNLPAVPVPTEVSASLLTSATTATTTIGAAVGGTLMNKQLAVIIVALAFLVGGGTGWISATRTSDARTMDAMRPGGEAAEQVANQKRLSELDAALSAAGEELEALRRQNSELRSERDSAVAAVAALRTASEPEPTDTDVLEEETIDWQRLSKMFAERVGVLDAVFRSEGGARLSQAEETKLIELFAQMATTAQQATTIASQPLFDEQIFGELAQALLGESLSMTPEQLAVVDELARGLVRDALRDMDLPRSLPLERARARNEMLSGLVTSADELITPEQKPTWDTVSNAISHLLEGNRRESRIGIAELDATQLTDMILDRWQENLGVRNEQRRRVAAHAADYERQVRQLLADYDQRAEGSRQLSDNEQAELRSRMLDQQIAIETRVATVLDEEQILSLIDTTPAFLIFDYGSEQREMRRNGPGF